MFNLFKYKKSQSPRPVKKRRAISSVQSYKRILDWGRSASPGAIKTLQEGAVMIKHPSSHEFRTRKKHLEKAGNMYIRKYMKSAERAQRCSDEFKSSHLETDKYNNHSPHNSSDWMRPTEVKRKVKVFKREIRVPDLFDYEALDVNKFHLPKWREDNKSPSTLNIKVDNGSAWKRMDSYVYGEPYVEGYEKLGDLTRKRNKTRECSGKEFRVSRYVDTSTNFDSIRSYLETQYTDLLSQKSYPTSYKSFFK
ncbi:unnamed protein product [Blepharisma stoltei]|uniref:Uncharacterized protein n=1 Tax=Blepharisma stoltei TaxID=1481888 RepID=A0AAU9K873_9CILI|nr:unnamed protein product [Blepharisma stoltei]